MRTQVLAACLITQIDYLNRALDLFNAAIVSPIYYVMFTLLSIVASVIMFRDVQTALQLATEACGFITIVGGTFVLHATRDLDGAALSLEALTKSDREGGGGGGGGGEGGGGGAAAARAAVGGGAASLRGRRPAAQQLELVAGAGGGGGGAGGASSGKHLALDVGGGGAGGGGAGGGGSGGGGDGGGDGEREDEPLIGGGSTRKR